MIKCRKAEWAEMSTCLLRSVNVSQEFEKKQAIAAPTEEPHLANTAQHCRHGYASRGMCFYSFISTQRRLARPRNRGNTGDNLSLRPSPSVAVACYFYREKSSGASSL